MSAHPAPTLCYVERVEKKGELLDACRTSSRLNCGVLINITVMAPLHVTQTGYGDIAIW
jgi:hypothetical protein